MKRFLSIAVVCSLALAFSVGCVNGSESIGEAATVNFAITDAPVDSSSISAVKATISSVAVNESADGAIPDSDGSWKIVAISPAKVIDLLSLQNGLAAALGELVITGGTQINQIRLGVDSVVVTESGADLVADIPSKTGLKIVNAFEVPLSGELTVTIDFDVRKSLIAKGNSGGYTLKPAIRAVVDNEAGKITGSAPVDSVVYAYAADAWNQATETVANADGLFFNGAYTSAMTKADGTYVLAFLEAGDYTVVSVNKADNAVLKTSAAISVSAGASTSSVNMVP